MPTIDQRARVGGSTYTVFTFDGAPLGWAQQVSHTSPRPVGPGPTPIHPMDSRYAQQIITPAAAGLGSITLNIYELYKGKVWNKLGSRGLLDGAVDIVDIFIRIAETAEGSVGMTKVIRPPKVAGQASGEYSEEYHGCVITDVAENETIEIGTMEVLKQVTVAYTHKTIAGKSSFNSPRK